MNERSGLGAVPRVVSDEASGVIALDLKHAWRSQERLRHEFDAHVLDNGRFETRVWERVAKLENLRWYAGGVIAAVMLLGGLLWTLGPRYMQLEMTEVVSRQIKAQSKEDLDSIGSKIDSLQKALEARAERDRGELEERIRQTVKKR